MKNIIFSITSRSAIMLSVLLGTSVYGDGDVLSFNDHVQPLLSEYCYHCHGPDSGTRMPKSNPLRLDIKEDAFQPRADGKPVIIAGDPDASLMVKRMRSKDIDEVMPPPEAHKTMKPEEIEILVRWIKQGAEYEDHWAFVPITRPALPSVKNASWPVNPVDHFTLAHMESANLTPNGDETPRRLYRRLAFDLTGLPPSIEDTDAFERAYTRDANQAIDQAAERLLATDASAEHFARHWLDAVRYGDTHGIHIDNVRNIWPYRDWVINAFRQNMPWDQFTTEQIAGDLIPNATLDQKVASGYNRCVATTGEGGAIAEEYYAIYAQDRTDTTGALWLGLTMSCAACHDHKFDPLTTKDFYAMTAFFRNSTMSALDGNKASHAPVVFVPTLEDRARFFALEPERASLRAQVQEREKTAGPDFEAWLVASLPDISTAVPSDTAFHLPLTEEKGPAKGSKNGEPFTVENALARADGRLSGKASVIAPDKSITVGDVGRFARDSSFSYGAWIKVAGKHGGAIIARMDAPDKKYRGWDLWLEGGKLGAHFIDQFPESATKIVSDQPLADGWRHVFVTWNGSLAADKAATLFVDGKPVAATYSFKAAGANFINDVPLRIGSREPDAKYKGQHVNPALALQDVRIYHRLLSHDEVAALAGASPLAEYAATPEAERTPQQKTALLKTFLTSHDPITSEFNKKLAALDKEEKDIRARGSDSLVMDDKSNTKASAHILIRGQYNEKGEQVFADTPTFLPPMPEDAPKNRLGLAAWINNPANPLPARVTMNRLWYYIFSTGIVETNGDFGIMGARPSHPQLLDWLASEFIDSGWNHRHMVRTLVTSRTYRQSSTVDPLKLEKDPANRLLARAPRPRLEAEPLRDMALAASGLLSTKVGGPSVRPYQPEGIWEAVAMKESNTRFYKQDAGESLFRRSMYTFWKRTAPPAAMEILNAPSREVFCVRREVTNTPLQAFVMMNDPQFLEACRVLATRAIQQGSEHSSRIEFIAQRLLSRPLNTAEKELVLDTIQTATAYYETNAKDASSFLAVGTVPPPADIPPATLAAWTLAASQVLNLDETLTK